MKKLYLLLAGFVISGILMGQQLNLSSLYNLNRYEVNPAVAGSETGLSTALSYRKAWTGIEGSPSSQFLTGHMQVVDRMGVGLKMFNGTMGPLRRTGMEATYAYHLPLNEGKSNISFGLSGIFYQYYLNKSKLNMQDPSDPVLLGPDQKITPDAAFGVYYYGSGYFAGISVYQLFGGKIRFDADNIAENQKIRHYFFNMGYSLSISNDFELEPSALLRVLGTGVEQVDINLYATYLKIVSLGLSYRSGNAMIIQLGYKNENLNIGYAYDLSFSDIKTVSSGSHELLFVYRFSNFIKK